MTTADLSVVVVRSPVDPAAPSSWSATSVATLVLPDVDAMSPCYTMAVGGVNVALMALPNTPTSRSPSVSVVIDGATTDVVELVVK